MPHPQELHSCPTWHTITQDWTDPDAIVTSIATAASAVSFSGVGLNGAVGAGSIKEAANVDGACCRVSATASSNAGSYVDGSTITVTGTNEAGDQISDTITVVGTDGGATWETSKGFATVTQIDVDAQANTGGSWTFGLGSLDFEEAGRLIATGATAMSSPMVVFDGNNNEKSLPMPASSLRPCHIRGVSRTHEAVVGDYPFTVFR